MGEHKDLEIALRHPAISLGPYADAATREADTSLQDTDVYGFAIQSDDESVWMLTDTTPTWLEISAHSFSAPSIYSSDGTIAANRTVTLEADLTFDPDADGSHDVEFGTAILTDRINSFNVYTQNSFGAYSGSQDNRSFLAIFGDLFTGLQLGYLEDEANYMGFNINLADDGNFEVVDAVDSKGLIYAADYSANWVDRSIVDKGYVDGLIGSASVYSADGSLSGNRRVTLGAFDLEFYTESTAGEWSVWAANGAPGAYSQRASIVVDHNLIVLSDAQASGGAENTLQSIQISPSGIVFTDLLNVRGVTYAADYSGAYTARSLVDRGYIDGLDLADFAGDISADTSVYLDGNDIVIYHGQSSGSPEAIMTFHGDKTGDLGSSRITLHDGGMFVSNETHVNFGKGTYAYWNDGTQVTTTFGIGSILNGSAVFQRMETDFFDTEHRYSNVRNWEWYFSDDTDNSRLRVFDSSDNQVMELTRNGNLSALSFDLRPYQVSGTGVSITDTEAQLDLSTIDIPNADYYTLSGDDITFTEGGSYFVSYSVELTIGNTAGASRDHCDTYCKLGTSILADSHGGAYTRSQSGTDNAGAGFLVSVTASQVLGLYAIMDANLNSVSQAATQLSIMKVGP